MRRIGALSRDRGISPERHDVRRGVRSNVGNMAFLTRRSFPDQKRKEVWRCAKLPGFPRGRSVGVLVTRYRCFGCQSHMVSPPDYAGVNLSEFTLSTEEV